MDFIKALVYLWSVFLLTELSISGNYLFIQVAMMLVKDLFGEINNNKNQLHSSRNSYSLKSLHLLQKPWLILWIQSEED